MKKILYTLLAIPLVFSLNSCDFFEDDGNENLDPGAQSFVNAVNTYGVYSKGAMLIEYEDGKYQYGVRDGGDVPYQFTLQNDAQSEYIVVTTSAMNFMEGDIVDVKIVASGVKSLLSQVLEMEVVEIDDDMIWFYNSDRDLGVTAEL